MFAIAPSLGGGERRHPEDVAGLAAALQASLDEIAQAIRLQVQVRLVGGRIDRTPGVVRMNLDGLDEKHAMDAARARVVSRRCVPGVMQRTIRH